MKQTLAIINAGLLGWVLGFIPQFEDPSIIYFGVVTAVVLAIGVVILWIDIITEKQL